MMKKAIPIIVILLVVGLIGVYKLGLKFSVPSITKTSATTLRPSIDISYSKCIPTRTKEDIEKFLNETPQVSINDRNVIIKAKILTYSTITRVDWSINYKSLNFYGPTMEVKVVEFTNESYEFNRYSKCIRDVELELNNVPKNVTYILVNWYKSWQNQLFWTTKIETYLG